MAGILSIALSFALLATSSLFAGAAPHTQPTPASTDPMVRQELADTLARQGKKQEALEHYLWCFDHGLEHHPEYYGVRLSFLLGRIRDLGEEHPPALEALRRRMRDAEAALLAGTGTRRRAHDYGALCRTLGETKSAVRTLKQLKARGPQGAPLCELVVDSLMGELLHSKQYEAILSVTGGDPNAWIERRIAHAQRTIDQMNKRAAQSPLERLRVAFVGAGFPLGQLTGYYEALVGAGQRDAADHLARRMLELDQSPQTVKALAAAARRAGARELADELLRWAPGRRGASPTSNPR